VVLPAFEVPETHPKPITVSVPAPPDAVTILQSPFRPFDGLFGQTVLADSFPMKLSSAVVSRALAMVNITSSIGAEPQTIRA
jgi:hypothetical protein